MRFFIRYFQCLNTVLEKLELAGNVPEEKPFFVPLGPPEACAFLSSASFRISELQCAEKELG